MRNTGDYGERRPGMPARLGLVAALLMATVVLALPQAAAAVPLVGKDGRIHACYRVKGKPKGMLRAVTGRKTRCHKGERKVSWPVAGVTGASGANGAPGAAGQPGAPGTEAGTGTAALESRIGVLTQRVEALERTLAGVSNAQLLGALADVKALCAQTSTLTGQVDALGSALGGLELGGLIPVGPRTAGARPAGRPAGIRLPVAGPRAAGRPSRHG